MRTKDPQRALRAIPSLDAFLRRAAFGAVPRAVVARVGRAYLDDVRRRVLQGELGEPDVAALFDAAAAEQDVLSRCARARAPRHARVVNATGIVLHTGLGRAPLAAAARDALLQAAGYALVELDPDTGERGQREEAVAALLGALTGAGSALAVNNNAGAVTLALAALAVGREVVVSRGQLVEIGGGFRMPEVMAQAGCRMVEVGTTNRTHLADYAAALSAETALLLLVHPSNFRVLGFTGAPPRTDVVALARQHGVRVLDDLGSGLLLAAAPHGLEDEPRVADAVADGADLVCFSGDKLLGGPQCGLVVGDAALVQQLRRHPLYRALRCDKLTLAALEATLRIYRDGDPLAEIPAMRALAAAPAELRARADVLAAELAGSGVRVVPSESFAGSGANPARPLASFAVALPGGDRIAAQLRAPGALPPVFARIANGEVLLDLRTLVDEDLGEVGAIVRARLHPA